MLQYHPSYISLFVGKDRLIWLQYHPSYISLYADRLIYLLEHKQSGGYKQCLFLHAIHTYMYVGGDVKWIRILKGKFHTA